MFNFADLSQAVIAGQEARVKELTQAAINSGADPLAIINEGLIAGMNVVGASFKSGQMFVPEVLMSARTMGAGMELVKPLLLGQEVPSAGKVVIGTVKGDLHDIGKNLVAMMLESAGFNVINLGIDLAPEKFVQAVKDYQPAGRRPVRPADDHHAGHERRHRTAQGRGIAGQGQGDYRRSADLLRLRQRDRRRRLCARCRLRRRSLPETVVVAR